MYTENETANGQNQRDGDVPMGKEQRQSQKPSSGIMVLSRVTWVWWKSTVAFGTARISLLDKDSLGQLWFFSRGQASSLVRIGQRLGIYTKLRGESLSG